MGSYRGQESGLPLPYIVRVLRRRPNPALVMELWIRNLRVMVLCPAEEAKSFVNPIGESAIHSAAPYQTPITGFIELGRE